MEHSKDRQKSMDHHTTGYGSDLCRLLGYKEEDTVPVLEVHSPTGDTVVK